MTSQASRILKMPSLIAPRDNCTKHPIARAETQGLASVYWSSGNDNHATQMVIPAFVVSIVFAVGNGVSSRYEILVAAEGTMLILVILALRAVLVRLRARVSKGSPLAVIPLLIVSFGKAESQLASDAPYNSSNQDSAVGKATLGGFRVRSRLLTISAATDVGTRDGRRKVSGQPEKGGKAVAIYTKHGKRVLQETIRIDADCFIGDKVFKFRAVVEGQRVVLLYYVTDLLADGGKTEIQDEIRALLSKQ